MRLFFFCSVGLLAAACSLSMNPDLPSGRGDDQGFEDGDGDFLAGDGDMDVTGAPNEGAMGGACGLGGAGGKSGRSPDSCEAGTK